MNPGSERNLQLLNRAYCYLRLSGVDPTLALQGLRSSLEVLGAGSEALWSQLQSLSAHPTQAVTSGPPVLRGHMHYPR